MFVEDVTRPGHDGSDGQCQSHPRLAGASDRSLTRCAAPRHRRRLEVAATQDTIPPTTTSTMRDTTVPKYLTPHDFDYCLRMTTIAEPLASELVSAHGVGRIYESPIPVWLYLTAGAVAVIGSFLIQARDRRGVKTRRPKLVASYRVAQAIEAVVRLVAILGFVMAVFFAFLDNERGFTIAPLLFWIGLIIGGTLLCSVVAGVWQRANPWATIESFFTREPRLPRVDPPWWLGPLLVYALFWFELVSGKGFDPTFIVMVLAAYTTYVLLVRPFADRSRWAEADPVAIMFGLASRSAPLVATDTGLYYRGPVAGLVEREPMSRSLFLSVFVLMSSTTLDNVRETVEWSSFLRWTGLNAVPDTLLDSFALAFFALPFLGLFLGAIAIARRYLGRIPLFELARRFGWSMAPIGIAYVLAHNMPLFILGLPSILEQALGSVGEDLVGGYRPSPQLVWFLEIALIVGGHVIGVLAAHRIALRTTSSHRAAVRSHVALTVLMSVFTFTTLYLLSLPLVAG